MGQVFGRGFDSRQVHFLMKVRRIQNNGIVSRKMRCNAVTFWIIYLSPNGMHKTKNSEALANINFTRISEKKIMPQTGIEPFYLISNTDRKGLWRLHHGRGVQKVFKHYFLKPGICKVLFFLLAITNPTIKIKFINSTTILPSILQLPPDKIGFPLITILNKCG